MRRIIIDTDTASDDVVAIIMALKSKEIHIEAITTVAGNCNVDLATLNELMTLEITDTYYPPVYKGASKPLYRDLVTATDVHGEDGMGDCDLVHPIRTHQSGNAVDKIIEIVKAYPNEIEIAVIGPATNIALAIQKDPKTMSLVKHIYSMGTGGFGPGNVTPVAEYNVYVDAESYDIMLRSGIQITIIGFDLCLGPAALIEKEMDFLLASNKKEAVFAIECNKTLREFNLKIGNGVQIDLPDPLAMAVLLWDDIVIESVKSFSYTCTKEDITYGQVVIHPEGSEVIQTHKKFIEPSNTIVCRTIDSRLFKQRMIDLLIK